MSNLPSARERLAGRVHVLEARLRIRAGDAVVTRDDHPELRELLDELDEARAELDAFDAGDRRRADLD